MKTPPSEAKAKKRQATILEYCTALSIALATVPEWKKTGHLLLRVDFCQGGFCGHSLHITEDMLICTAEATRLTQVE